VDLAVEQLKPSHVAGHLLEIRQLVNSYLRRKDLPKIKDLEGDLRVARLSLVRVAAEVLRTGLELLGLEATEQM
jgi:arginyl-tRNA synthetase